MEASLQQKQQFLRSQILDAGVDPQSFMAFMGTIKQQGQSINLQNWSIQQLRQVVQDFKMSVQQQINRAKNQQLLGRKSKQLMTNKIIESLTRKQKVHYEQNGLWDYQMYTQQQCRKINKLFEFKNEPQIDYKGWQIKKTGGIIFGIGSRNQLQITFITNFTSNTVTRKSEDVDWLRQTLLAKFPGSYVPPLEQARYIEPEDKVNIMRRIKLIIFFLNSLVNFQHLVQNKYFYMFINEKDTKNFNSFRNTQIATRSPVDISSIQNLQGKFSVQISKRVLNFVKQSSDFGKAADEVYTSLQTNIRKMMGDLETLSKHSHYVANDFAKFHDRYNRLYDKCGFKNSQTGQKTGSILVFLNNMFTNIGNNYKKQMTMLKQTAQQFLKYAHTSWYQFLLHEKKFNIQLNNYLTAKSNLLKKKERNFNDVTKWQLDQKEALRMSRINTAKLDKQQAFQIMFPRDNRNEQQMRIWQAYINDMYQKTFKILINQQQKQYLKHFSKFSYKLEKASLDQKQMFQRFKQIFGSVVKSDPKLSQT